jgi:prefoldin alpha subunit
MPENKEENMENLAIRAQVLENQRQYIERQILNIEDMVRQINDTIETIENLKEAKNKGLIPIGSGTYITCKDIDDQLFVSVGSNFIVKKSPTEAKEFLEKKRKELNKLLEDGRKKLELVNALIEDVNKQAAALSTRMENV